MCGMAWDGRRMWQPTCTAGSVDADPPLSNYIPALNQGWLRKPTHTMEGGCVS